MQQKDPHTYVLVRYRAALCSLPCTEKTNKQKTLSMSTAALILNICL